MLVNNKLEPFDINSVSRNKRQNATNGGRALLIPVHCSNNESGEGVSAKASASARE